MTATFDSEECGRIEVKRCNSTGSWAGIAYFFGLDYETEVNDGGRFEDMNGRIFQVFWPMRADGTAVLDMIAPRTIGRASIA